MKRFSNIKILVIVLVLVLGLVFFNIPSVQRQTKNIFYNITAPFGKFFGHTIRKTYAFLDFLKTINEISKENALLKSENKRLLSENIKLQETEKENEFLRAALKISQNRKQSFNYELAYIIGRAPQGLATYIIIDKGERQGIKKNMPVIFSESILLGKISEVLDDFSKVLLISDSKSEVNALVQEFRALGVVKGSQGLTLLMDFISKEDKVEKDNIVITSGIGGIFPRGLIIGEVEKVIFSEDQIFQKALIKPAIDVRDVEMVLIIK